MATSSLNITPADRALLIDTINEAHDIMQATRYARFTSRSDRMVCRIFDRLMSYHQYNTPAETP